MNTRSGSTIKRGVTGPVASVAVAAVLAGAAGASHAADFNIGPVQARTSAYVSLGTIIRAEDRDAGLAASQAGDRAFDQWDPVSSVLKATADIDLSYENYGVFLRGNAWRDFTLENESGLDDSNFPSEQKFTGAQLLDAYLYGEWDVASMPVGLRAGRHALAWGEALMLGGGINVMNPYDVAALRRAGSQLKESLLPVGMVSANVGVTNELNIGAFYQYEWEPTRLDQCGTFFSTFDGIQEGCTTAFGLPGTFEKPDDGGQYGISGRYYSMPLNTEFGAYYVNYHSRLPFLRMGGFTNVPGVGVVPTNYSVFFPEDIEVFGVSAATTLGGKAVYGEIAYRPDMPVSNLAAPSAYDTLEDWNLIVGTIFSVSRVLGADELSVIAEAGYNHTDGITAAHGGATSNSWGYRVLLSAPYTDVIWGANLTPSLGFNHDVNGRSANNNFLEDRITTTLGLKVEYLKNYTLDVSYTANIGDKSGQYLNTSHDRDFIAIAATVNF